MKPKKVVPEYIHAAGVIVSRGRVLLAQRPSKGLLAGMWEFPNGRVNGDPAKGLARVLKTGYSLNIRPKRNKEVLTTVQHAYTHFKVTVHAFQCELGSIIHNGTLKWVLLNELNDYPMGKIDRQIANMIAKTAK